MKQDKKRGFYHMTLRVCQEISQNLTMVMAKLGPTWAATLDIGH